MSKLRGKVVGSVTVDEDLMEAAGLVEGEQVQVQPAVHCAGRGRATRPA